MTKNNPWTVCAAGALLLFCTVGLAVTSFGVYQPFLIRDIGLTNSQSSLFLTVRTFSGLCTTFLVQAYLRRTGLRVGVTLAGFCSAAAFLVLAFSKGFGSTCIAAVLMGMGYGLGGTVAVSIIINRVFTEHVGLALSICAAGTGVSMMICPPIVTWAIERFSLRSSLIAEAVFIAAAALIAFSVFGVLGSEKGSAERAKRGGFEFLHDRKRIMCLIAMLFIGSIGNTGWSHFGVLYSTAGFPPETVAMLISLVGVFLTVGKIIFGECADRFGTGVTFRVSCVIMIAGLALCCGADTRSLPVACAAMLFLGISLPIATVGHGIFARAMVAPEDFDAAVKQQQLAYMIGSLLFGPVPGMIADVRGSYVPSYIILTVFGILASALIFTIFRKQK